MLLGFLQLINCPALMWLGLGKVEDWVPEERNPICAFGTKELRQTFPEERHQRLYFWRNGKMSSEPRENFPTVLVATLSSLANLYFIYALLWFLCFSFLRSKHLSRLFPVFFCSSVLPFHSYLFPVLFSFPLFFVPLFQTDPKLAFLTAAHTYGLLEKLMLDVVFRLFYYFFQGAYL